MKRTLAALVLLLCLASCQRGIKTNVFTDEMKLPLAEGCQDTLSVQILLEYPVGEDSVSQAMNRSILAFAFDMEEDPTTVEETAARFEAGLVDAYFDEMAPIHAEEEDQELAGIQSNIDLYNGLIEEKEAEIAQTTLELEEAETSSPPLTGTRRPTTPSSSRTSRRTAAST